MFDLDGTLFDTKKVNYYSYKQALVESGYDMTYEYYVNECDGKNYLEFIPPISSNDKSFLTTIHDKKKKYYKNYLSEAVVNQELIDFIKANRHRSYIVLSTTASRDNCYEILEHFHLKHLFDKIITKEDVVKTKPDPECYTKPVEFYGFDKANCEIFEDSVTGIQAARNAGIKCHIVNAFQ